MKNYWVIGDVHGEIVLLERLLETIDTFEPSGLVFVGDYIDRGPASREVVDLLISLGQKATCLLGNHEMMMLNALDDLGFGESPAELWYYNGGEATILSFGFSSFFHFRSDLDQHYLDFFRELDMACRITGPAKTDILVSHAGVSPAIPVNDQLQMKNYQDLRKYILDKEMDPADSFLWTREAFFTADPELWKGYLAVHGHTPVAKLRRFLLPRTNQEFFFLENDICLRKAGGQAGVVSVDIDSGSVLSGRLSGIGFFEHEDPGGSPFWKMRSITVSREDVFPRDLGQVN